MPANTVKADHLFCKKFKNGGKYKITVLQDVKARMQASNLVLRKDAEFIATFYATVRDGFARFILQSGDKPTPLDIVIAGIQEHYSFEDLDKPKKGRR